MTGLLSLLDALLQMPLQNVVKQLNIPEFIEQALLNNEGELGHLLALEKQLEQSEITGAVGLLEQDPHLLRMISGRLNWAP